MMMSPKFCHIMLSLPLMERMKHLTPKRIDLYILANMLDEYALPIVVEEPHAELTHLLNVRRRIARLEQRNLPSGPCLPRIIPSSPQEPVA